MANLSYRGRLTGALNWTQHDDCRIDVYLRAMMIERGGEEARSNTGIYCMGLNALRQTN